MAKLSEFYGLQIYVYDENNSKHHKAHIHVVCGQEEAVVFFLSGKIKGNLSKRNRKLILAWIELHRDELSDAWYHINNGEKPEMIMPLR